MPARPRSARAAAVLALVVGLVVLAAGCRTDVDVHVRVGADGAGTVTVTVDLDAEATAQVGDPAALALEDLTSAGWKLTGPTAHDGGLRIVAVRTFGSPEQLAAVLQEVGGADGVFRNTSLELSDGFASSSSAFRTDLHLTGDIAQFSDEQLTQVLGGLPLGRTPEELAALGADKADAATLTVRVELPGGVDESSGRITNGVAAWRAPLSGGTATTSTLTASSSDRRTTTLALVGAGAALLLAAVVVAVVGVLRRRSDAV